MKILALAFAALVVVGCAQNNPVPEVQVANPIRIDPPEFPRPMTLLEIKWQVQNIEEILDMLAAFGVLTPAEAQAAKERSKTLPVNSSFAQFTLTTENYENLALNLQELKRYLEQQNVVIDYFIQATEPTRINPKLEEPKS